MPGENQDQVIRVGGAAAAGGLLGALIGGPIGAAAGAGVGVWLAEQLGELQGGNQETRSAPQKGSTFLVLAFRTSEIESISSIPIGKPLDEDSCKKLFQCSKYMWKGSSQSFNTNNFMDLIKGRNIQKADPSDEYAFHLIALEVDKDISSKLDRGLDKGVDLLDKLDAFMQLAGRARIVGVSPPLLPASFEHKGFYKLV
ncbi:hypothetical protein [Thermostichus vulcanus]|uniref:Glycine zipper domain-containing protein n=1 Tax=Thermostichus vulcanus str. 'Rupite' TaxID=2813851 RepID=A0ABT0CD34_THEVL|nr:hypothetical protein [Thermostichus vulcanus]MCJ2543699.1 hypothetical protein [Thermostichus vulcanus str. 'Rupite']